MFFCLLAMFNACALQQGLVVGAPSNEEVDEVVAKVHLISWLTSNLIHIG